MRLLSLVLLSLLPLSAQPPSDVQAYVPILTPVHRVEAANPQDLTGIVRILVTIDPQGKVANAEALTGPEALRTPALDAVRQWKYRPVMRGGGTVAAYTDAIVTFFLKDKPFKASPNLTEEVTALQRIAELTKRFPRSKQQILADLEQDSGGEDTQWYSAALPRLAKAALDAGEWDAAERYARELLDSSKEPRDWNYGNALHDGNMVLGLAAIQHDDLAAARKYLIAAGQTAGSPQLNSFGPNMTLAKALLQKGDKETVLEYFSLCRAFWKMGGARLDEWSATVRGGGIPSFGANLMY
jgi:TonB family protein